MGKLMEIFLHFQRTERSPAEGEKIGTEKKECRKENNGVFNSRTEVREKHSMEAEKNKDGGDEQVECPPPAEKKAN